MIKILIVDDENAMREGLSDNLIFEGYATDMAANGQEALDKLATQQYDLMVLDVMMPGMSGFDVCKKIRQLGNQIPVILLTAKGEELDRILGLEFGADDYMVKPFSVRELMARIKAILRRTQAITSKTSVEKIETIGLLKVNFKKYEAQIGNEKVKLSHREFEVLHFLWTHRQEVVSRNDLLKNIWQYDELPTTRTIDNFILRLRQKIEVDPNNPQIILTVHGIGYKMI